jgi:hypothetical protein
MTNNNFCFYLQNRLIQTSQTGGQLYSDTPPFSIPWLVLGGGEAEKHGGDHHQPEDGEKEATGDKIFKLFCQ